MLISKIRDIIVFFEFLLLLNKGGDDRMAKNAPIGDGRRIGAVTKRSQVFNPVTKQWVKRNAETGQFMDVKQNGTPFKGVRKERN